MSKYYCIWLQLANPNLYVKFFVIGRLILKLLFEDTGTLSMYSLCLTNVCSCAELCAIYFQPMRSVLFII